MSGQGLGTQTGTTTTNAALLDLTGLNALQQQQLQQQLLQQQLMQQSTVTTSAASPPPPRLTAAERRAAAQAKANEKKIKAAEAAQKWKVKSSSLTARVSN